MSDRPLILTLRLAPEAEAHFTALRRRYFPPERNVIDAHVTVFHHLPGDEPEAVEAVVADAVRGVARFPVEVTEPYSLGGGVAFRLSAPTLAPIRARIASLMADRLTPQDRQPHRPHVTIQNKAGKRVAQRTMGEVAADFVPWTTTATGLSLWFYEGGPWSPFRDFPFAD